MPPRDRRTSRPPINTSRLFEGAASGEQSDLDYLLASGMDDTATRARERGLPLRHLSVTSVAPDLHQLRRLPRPEVLLQREAQGDTSVSDLIAGLRALGQSIRDHGQIQPVVVYAERDPEDALIAYRLLHGQRRWTATVLEGLTTIWAVEVPKPSDSDRLQRQFDENERREDFTDMERAWAIMALREALMAQHEHDVLWSEVEQRLGLSESRRRDLLRLLRFDTDGQELALRYRWPEWTLRPLHMAVSAGEIDPATATQIMRGLANHQEHVTSSLVASLVAAQQLPTEPDAAAVSVDSSLGMLGGTSSRQTQMPTLVRQLQKARRGMEQINKQVQAGIDQDMRDALMQEAVIVMKSLEQLLLTLDGQSSSSKNTE
ncbi:MAG: ParB N-terminal domain-containing protein [Oscillochloridaceae bacterium umkhey_bin13]